MSHLEPKDVHLETSDSEDVSKLEDSSENTEDDIGVYTVSEVLLELDEGLKSRLVDDLKQICEVDANTAIFTLEAHQWNMQKAIDFLLSSNNSDSDDDSQDVQMLTQVPASSDLGASANSKCNDTTEDQVKVGIPGRIEHSVQLSDVCSPEADGRKEKETELERRLPCTPGVSGYSSWAPEKFSVLSWNLDGLDDKNLEKRCSYVVELVEKEKHDVLFFQELLPYTFDYIARRLLPNYKPIPGTEDPSCEYMTATFLRKNSVYYEDHYVMPFPNTAMGRTLLVTKAFIGRSKLALLNSHLESTAEFSQQRMVQLKICFDLASSFDPEYNIVFGGDLNLRDKEVGGNLPDSMCDLWVQCGSRRSCQYTWDLTRNTNKQMPSKYQPKCRFDRFYFRSSQPQNLTPEFFGVTGIEKVPGTQSFPSDHWAIITFFALSKEARKPAPKKRRADEDTDFEGTAVAAVL